MRINVSINPYVVAEKCAMQDINVPYCIVADADSTFEERVQAVYNRMHLQDAEKALQSLKDTAKYLIADAEKKEVEEVTEADIVDYLKTSEDTAEIFKSLTNEIKDYKKLTAKGAGSSISLNVLEQAFVRCMGYSKQDIAMNEEQTKLFHALYEACERYYPVWSIGKKSEEAENIIRTRYRDAVNSLLVGTYTYEQTTDGRQVFESANMCKPLHKITATHLVSVMNAIFPKVKALHSKETKNGISRAGFRATFPKESVFIVSLLNRFFLMQGVNVPELEKKTKK